MNLLNHLAFESSTETSSTNGERDESAMLSAASATDANELALTVKRRRMLAEKEREQRMKREREMREERIKREREFRLQKQEADARAKEEREFAALDREYNVRLL